MNVEEFLSLADALKARFGTEMAEDAGETQGTDDDGEDVSEDATFASP